LLCTVVEVYQPTADEKRQSLSAEIAPDLITFGDRELLAQMFANLLENALRHSPEGATVHVTASVADDIVSVVLADTGPGIPAAEYENVFRRFYRLEESRTTPGNGLGLSLVSAISALHGITVELSDNSPGLRVALKWPARPDPFSGSGSPGVHSR
jgi:signal transduction histidine kinase